MSFVRVRTFHLFLRKWAINTANSSVSCGGRIEEVGTVNETDKVQYVQDLTAKGVSEQVQTCLCATVQPDHLLRLDVEHDVLPEARLVDL